MDSQSALIRLRLATAADDSALRALLASVNLPYDDVSSDRQEFIVAVAGDQIVGCGALEVFGKAALLRSLAVAECHRGAGLGGQLCDRLLTAAAERMMTHVYLLTTTAAPYFARRGFATVARDAVPEPLTKSAQFASLCPSSAICMILHH